MKPLCALCKGRHFCGNRNCPIALKMKTIELSLSGSGGKDTLFGASPPSVFVGNYGYPKVYIGGLAPMQSGDTSVYDNPIVWAKDKLSIENIFDLRSSLVNSRTVVDIKKGGMFLESMQELAMASKPADVEVRYTKPLHADISFFDRATAQGPSGEIKRFSICDNVKVERKVDKIVCDTDLKAAEAVTGLQESGVGEYNIVKLISSGLLGMNRKLVPTRWSITAVDDIISKDAMERVRRYDSIDDFLVFSHEYLGNHFEIVLLPSHFRYEVIEAVLPESAYGKNCENVNIITDYEEFKGRTKYASSVAGGYYAARLPVVNYLDSLKKQASVLVFREIKPDYYMPLGVWVVRETVRDALKNGFTVFDSLENALKDVASRVSIPINLLIGKSRLLKTFKNQKNLSDFV